MRSIQQVASELGLGPRDLFTYGDQMAKLRLPAWGDEPGSARLVLVTAMSPSPAGEGKTTVAIGLTDALRRMGARAVVALREPSMGPVFGKKGGGTGGGRAQLWPAERINLHFTGDLHAVTSAHNLLAAALDNHLHFGNALDLDVRRLTFRRVMDQNDRALRQIVVGLGGRHHGIPREDRFDITAASEVMAVLALSRDYADLKKRLGRIIVGLDRSGRPVTASSLEVEGAMAALLSDALMPNLAQTIEGTPALVHCGPFANIAHGTSSVVATRLALQQAEVVVQEAGFGAELGAEKFLDIFCRELGRFPNLAVVVATRRALTLHGLDNLKAHLELLERFGLPTLVALNEMEGDPPDELDLPHVPVRVYQEGGEGALALARQVLESGPPAAVRPAYELNASLVDKISSLATGVYGADGVEYTPRARTQLEECASFGYGGAYVCVAKTQSSLSDDPRRPGRPRGFKLGVRSVYLLGGAGFVVPLCGEIMTMPGLGKHPNYEEIDLSPDGVVTGI